MKKLYILPLPHCIEQINHLFALEICSKDQNKTNKNIRLKYIK